MKSGERKMKKKKILGRSSDLDVQLLISYSYHLPGFSFCAIAYDYAGNSETDDFIWPGLCVS